MVELSREERLAAIGQTEETLIENDLTLEDAERIYKSYYDSLKPCGSKCRDTSFFKEFVDIPEMDNLPFHIHDPD